MLRLPHLSFEAPDSTIVSPAHARALVETRLAIWPRGMERVLATSDVNGRHVRCWSSSSLKRSRRP
jgi:hypothetical protein